VRSKKYSVSLIRHSSSLLERHAEFLELAKGNGEGEVKLDHRGKVLEIVVMNKRKRNALSGTMMFQLAHVVEEVHRIVKTDNNVIGLAIRGEGLDTFCSGADLEFAGKILNKSERGVLMAKFMTDALNSIRQSGLISVCCLNGTVVGGGAELATVGDFRIMADRKDYFIQFVHAKIGAAPGWGGAQRLANIVGRKEAIKLACSAKRISAQDAIDIGFVDELESINEEQEWVSVIDEFFRPFSELQYPLSTRAIKRAISGTEYLPPNEASELEIESFRSRWYSQDHKAVMDKVLNKQK
jgi:ethylmalonyl-CoA/methylmalonyl-CoA decarboxylase